MYHQIFALIINQVQFLALVYKYSSSVFKFKSALGVKKMKAFHKDFFSQSLKCCYTDLKILQCTSKQMSYQCKGGKANWNSVNTISIILCMYLLQVYLASFKMNIIYIYFIQ